jgi:hypothetical protein
MDFAVPTLQDNAVTDNNKHSTTVIKQPLNRERQKQQQIQEKYAATTTNLAHMITTVQSGTHRNSNASNNTNDESTHQYANVDKMVTTLAAAVAANSVERRRPIVVVRISSARTASVLPVNKMPT